MFLFSISFAHNRPTLTTQWVLWLIKSLDAHFDLNPYLDVGRNFNDFCGILHFCVIAIVQRGQIFGVQWREVEDGCILFCWTYDSLIRACDFHSDCLTLTHVEIEKINHRPCDIGPRREGINFGPRIKRTRVYQIGHVNRVPKPFHIALFWPSGMLFKAGPF